MTDMNNYITIYIYIKAEYETVEETVPVIVLAL